METFFVIELHPIKKIYFNSFHHGAVCESSIKECRKFKTYDLAYKTLIDIVKMNNNEEYYISIVKMFS